mmetsp:Transcript_17055/g.35475  ORF Transcript_17055/g.35475 Transcript_17055/m.35475 type:complete len:99 (+) Transcript_17055:330-626(+)
MELDHVAGAEGSEIPRQAFTSKRTRAIKNPGKVKRGSVPIYGAPSVSEWVGLPKPFQMEVAHSRHSLDSLATTMSCASDEPHSGNSQRLSVRSVRFVN